MQYNTEDANYLGSTEDMAHHPLDAFHVNNEIHLVYQLGSSEQHVATAMISDVQDDLDKYLWTPFALFIGKV